MQLFCLYCLTRTFKPFILPFLSNCNFQTFLAFYLNSNFWTFLAIFSNLNSWTFLNLFLLTLTCKANFFLSLRQRDCLENLFIRYCSTPDSKLFTYCWITQEKQWLFYRECTYIIFAHPDLSLRKIIDNFHCDACQRYKIDGT